MTNRRFGLIDLSYNQQSRVGSRRGPGTNLGSSPGQTSVGQSPAHRVLVYQILDGREGDTEKMRGECWTLQLVDLEVWV